MEIPLRARDGSVKAVAVVDDEDTWMAGLRWYLHSAGYAARKVPPRGTVQYMHRQILQLKLGRELGRHEQSHHDDEDKLNNQRDNLLLQIRGPHQRLHLHRKGAFVNLDKRRGTWYAYTPAPRQHLGTFESRELAEEAARHYLEATS